jgi:pyridoxal phosphate enzyme (YggS family)
MAGMSNVIENNLGHVRARIAAACARARRPKESVRLIAVSKTKPIEDVSEALQAGQTSFGENYVQELLEKQEALPQADWHYIGSLQTNKAKQIVGRCSLIHSVDRAKLALELAKAATAAGVVQDILLQVHVGDEETKSGIALADAPALIELIGGESSLCLRGVMALPPLSENEAIARGYFREVRTAFEKWRSALSPSAASVFSELSLGTSSDYEWAILEGATLVRVGTAIFGAREA